MDYSIINRTLEEMAIDRKAITDQERSHQLPVLRAAGIRWLEAWYDGYGDSGNIEDEAIWLGSEKTPVSVNATTLTPLDIDRLRDFLWMVVYNLHPGFEINDGGRGEIRWDVRADRIDVDHSERFVDTNEYCHEDV